MERYYGKTKAICRIHGCGQTAVRGTYPRLCGYHDEMDEDATVCKKCGAPRGGFVRRLKTDKSKWVLYEGEYRKTNPDYTMANKVTMDIETSLCRYCHYTEFER